MELGFDGLADDLESAAWALEAAWAGPSLLVLDDALDATLGVIAFELCDAGFAATIVEPRSLGVRFMGSDGAFVAYQAVVHLWGA